MSSVPSSFSLLRRDSNDKSCKKVNRTSLRVSTYPNSFKSFGSNSLVPICQPYLVLVSASASASASLSACLCYHLLPTLPTSFITSPILHPPHLLLTSISTCLTLHLPPLLLTSPFVGLTFSTGAPKSRRHFFSLQTHARDNLEAY